MRDLKQEGKMDKNMQTNKQRNIELGFNCLLGRGQANGDYIQVCYDSYAREVEGRGGKGGGGNTELLLSV